MHDETNGRSSVVQWDSPGPSRLICPTLSETQDKKVRGHPDLSTLQTTQSLLFSCPLHIV